MGQLLRWSTYRTTLSILRYHRKNWHINFCPSGSHGGDGVQIIDITDPYNPILASVVIDGANGFTELTGSIFVTTVKIGTSTYALVAAVIDVASKS